MKLKYFSYSGIQSFINCPAQFKYRYIDKLYKKDESIEAFMGKRVHETIEYLFNQKLNGHTISYDNLIKYHHDLWGSLWHNRIAIVNRQILPIDREKNIPLWKKYAAFYFRTGEKCITNFYMMNKPFNQNVYANEYRMDFLLDENENYRIKGVADRVDVDRNGNWEIHDYKTGKRIISQKEANNSLQLGLYQIGLLQKNSNVSSIALVWHFLQQKKENIIVRAKINNQSLKNLKNKIKTIIDRIRNKIHIDENFEPKTSLLCNWCYYWEECPGQTKTNPFIGTKNV